MSPMGHAIQPRTQASQFITGRQNRDATLLPTKLEFSAPTERNWTRRRERLIDMSFIGCFPFGVEPHGADSVWGEEFVRLKKKKADISDWNACLKFEKLQGD